MKWGVLLRGGGRRSSSITFCNVGSGTVRRGPAFPFPPESAAGTQLCKEQRKAREQADRRDGVPREGGRSPGAPYRLWKARKVWGRTVPTASLSVYGRTENVHIERTGSHGGYCMRPSVPGVQGNGSPKLFEGCREHLPRAHRVTAALKRWWRERKSFCRKERHAHAGGASRSPAHIQLARGSHAHACREHQSLEAP